METVDPGVRQRYVSHSSPSAGLPCVSSLLLLLSIGLLLPVSFFPSLSFRLFLFVSSSPVSLFSSHVNMPLPPTQWSHARYSSRPASIAHQLSILPRSTREASSRSSEHGYSHYTTAYRYLPSSTIILFCLSSVRRKHDLHIRVAQSRRE